MSNEVKDAGFKAGTEGKTSNDNPHDSGILGRAFDIAVDVGSGGLAGQVASSDKNSSDWESAREAGESSVKNNK